ncbi:MAG: SAM hydrolase/SAM-dependent halogenase family protein [Acidimicrobiales bacterium]
MSLLSDYGLEDGFVGALHSVLRRRVPDLPIVDLTHGVRRQDVRAGSLALLRAVPYLAPGVVVAIVDPGVGTARRGVAVRSGPVSLVGPDNGLLVPDVEALRVASGAVELEDRGYWFHPPGPTFAGRDIFAPAAGVLAAGGDLSDLGPPLERQGLVRLPQPVCRRRPDGALEAEVTWVDRFGNVELAAGPSDLPAPDAVAVSPAPPAGQSRPVRVVRAFSELGPGELGLLVDSYGHLALCVYGASAADLLGTREEGLVLLSRL